MDRRTHDRRKSEPYSGFVHISLYNDLIANDSRGKWKCAYRRARRAGTAYMLPQWVVAQYPVADVPAEIGAVESFRFVGG